MYKKLQGKKKRQVLAAIVTLISSFLIVILPLAFVVFSATGQLASFAEVASREQYWQRVPDVARGAIRTVNDIVSPITGVTPSITEDGIIEYLSSVVPAMARGFSQLALAVISNIPGFVMSLFIYIYVFLAMLKYGPDLIKKLYKISPFDKQTNDQYLSKIGAMTNAMVKGQIILSMITAAFTATLMIFLGYGHLFFVLFVLFTILNFIPLGSGVIVVPLVLWSMLSGQFWVGLLVIGLYYMFGNLEPIWRTKLIPKDVQMPVALTFVATICGISYFGILGVVYGPVIVIFITTTIDLYIKSKSPAIAG